MNTKQLLEDLEHGDSSAAFEAARTLSNLPRLPARRVIEVLGRAESVHNREAITYTLSWLRRKDNQEILRALLNIVNNAHENSAVRGQALEGLGVQKSGPRGKLWRDIERTILTSLKNPSVEVRFWACYAAGSLRMKSALPQLREFAENDSAIYPRWWRVSEEAADAIEWVFGRATDVRMRANAQS